jgi:membrane protein implicated in regulation of membrane protease activity
LFGYSLEMVYLTVLIVIGCCTVLYLFFADLADVSVDSLPFLDPAVILSFITFTAAGGFFLERFMNLSSLVNFIIALIVASILSVILYYFLLVPLRSAEVSLAYTDESLESQVAKVIVPIPLDGFGEIVIESVNGIISKRAASYDNVEIPYDTRVLIIEMRDGTAYVANYENEIFTT